MVPLVRVDACQALTRWEISPCAEMKRKPGASLVVQWLGIRLLMQETWV